VLIIPSYVHGGAWRDPLITALTFLPTITCLLGSHVEEHIAGFSSLDYRLSPHPSFPQDVSTTPPRRLRNAKHPDHIQDIRSSLTFLEKTYNIADRYILVGHSCGATLAFQTVMEIGDNIVATNLCPSPPNPGPKPLLPSAIIGVAGIYDLRLLRNNHVQIPAYQTFLQDAFGPDEEVWDRVSPARRGKFKETWKIGGNQGRTARVVVLATSTEDEMIEGEQLVVMKRRMDELISADANLRVLVWDKKLKVTHDVIWERGEGIAELVALAIKELMALQRWAAGRSE
jgi:pimeloyl-ACP methyl ester carboxylesterase